jgi:outer membrane putative beta-barrel porin/alpha-amylase
MRKEIPSAAGTSIAYACLALLLSLWPSPMAAQELEPRAYSVSPVKTNFVVLSNAYAAGDLSFDPSLPVEDGSANINTMVAGYFRSMNVFGRSGNLTLVVPYSFGTVQGLLAGEFTQVTRSGLKDPTVRFAVNLYGAPAMRLKEFAAWSKKTVIGASVVVAAPLGQYDPAKLINIGSNRWAFKPELGWSRRFGHWVLDAYGGVWLFTDNKTFYPGARTRSQAPILSTQFHLSYNFHFRLWAGADANLYSGGRTSINGVPNQDLQKNSRLGGTVSIPLTRRQSFKFSYSRGAYTTIGADFQAVAVGWQYFWGTWTVGVSQKPGSPANRLSTAC